MNSYQKQQFLFFVVSPIDEEIEMALSRLIDKLKSLRRWVIGPPELVDQIDEPDNPGGSDQPVRTLGGVLELYSALPPNALPQDIDKAHLEEIKGLINDLIGFSRENECEIECELDGNYIGTIDKGKADDGIAIGLIAEWERVSGI